MRLLAFLRPYRASLIVSSVLAIGSQVAAIFIPIVTGVVFNELEGDAERGSLAFWIVVSVR